MWNSCLCTFCCLPVMLISSVTFGISLYAPCEGEQPSYTNRSKFKTVSSEIQLKHSSASTIQTTVAIAAIDLPEEEILGPLCTRKELQQCARSIALKGEHTILVLFLQLFSPSLSSTMKYPTPHRQNNIRGSIFVTLFAQSKDWFSASKL